MNLNDKEISYVIISSYVDLNSSVQNKISYEKLCTILYAKEYNIIEINSYYEGKYEKSVIGFNNLESEKLKTDVLYLMNEFDQKSAIIKYTNEDPIKLIKNGVEIPLKLSVYGSNFNDKVYIYNGLSFSFEEMKKYKYPKEKKDLKSGMTIEFFNNDSWIERVISDVDTEYDKMYKLLIKYEKLRYVE